MIRRFIHKISCLVKRALIYMLRFYQKFISPMKRHASCRFIPTCSQYAIEAIEKYGPIKGFFLAVKRIFKCNPFSKGGYDPVP